MVEESENSLKTALHMAIAGNIIDYDALREFNLERPIKNVYAKRFAIDKSEKLKEKLQSAETLLFFADNAGEIVFD